MTTKTTGGALRRTILPLMVAALMAAITAASALPAMAKNSGDQPSGPPLYTGNVDRAAVVIHCGAEKAGGTRGVLSENSNGKHTNNCDARIP